MRIAVGAVLIAMVAVANPAWASRCQGGITNGDQCTCPVFADLLSKGTVNCGPGFTPVIYDLDRPFAPDNTTSHLTVRGQPGTPCDGLVKDIRIRGQLVGCWGALIGGCRTFRVPFNGVCLHMDPAPLGAPCTGDCANLTTEQVAIGTAGSASFTVCAPKDPMTSCRSSNPFGSDLFRFQTGGLCDTYGCSAGTPNPNACVKDWGATYWGFPRHNNPPGWYDWLSGGFKVTVTGNRATCNVYASCLGKHAKNWTLVTVANPAAGYDAPCPASAGPCVPAACSASTTTTTTTTAPTTTSTTTTVSTSTTSST